MEWTLRVTMIQSPLLGEKHPCGLGASSMKTQKRQMKNPISTLWMNFWRDVKTSVLRGEKHQKKVNHARICVYLYTI